MPDSAEDELHASSQALPTSFQAVPKLGFNDDLFGAPDPLVDVGEAPTSLRDVLSFDRGGSVGLDFRLDFRLVTRP